jgi:hypothetical protein
MTLISMRWSLLATAFALLSCTTQPPVDPLEAKARDGDPLASCQLVARSLHSCALEKQKWESGELSARPACVNDGISDQQEAYLDAAQDKLQKSGGKAMLFQIQQILLLSTQVALVVSPGDKMVESTATLEQGCIEMADVLKP